ncbi:AraC family transcriptional regulator [Mycolicibacterium smegmatis MC2 155]|uniref:AraC family transcriptional regulator n=2 Tax=Mycolicibacterium smegmatis TaxID=1772 RepID=I7FM00_MYCS2|nr:AraC family transcriptional regulator [Mycolicibacterium smegmatis MC2 155]SUA34472.1 AraC family transcriptional regulator [Mycolicibacterium smegmatis]
MAKNVGYVSLTTLPARLKLDDMKAVAVVGFSGVQALDVVGPFETFTCASRFVDDETWQLEGYEVMLASVDGQPVPASTGLGLMACPLPDPEQVDTVVIPGGVGVRQAAADPALMTWFREAAEHARRIVSVCTGAFLVAEAGLLNGCQATTHWAFADELAQRYPEVRVDPNPMFVRSSRQVWTAAGVSAGIDLALALVEDDHSTEVAKAVARWLVLSLRRPGGQAQFAAPIWTPRARRDEIRLVQEVIEANPAAPHTIDTLATSAAMSTRHFTRVFTSEVGEGPGRYVDRVRTQAARRQLEETTDTVAAIAARCGFGTPETMRRNFIRLLGVSPEAYRKAFN